MALKIPIPPELSHLKVDARGFPIPYNILIDSKGQPHFKVNDEQKAMQILAQGLCHVCGKKLGTDTWMIGGHLSAFHPRGAFNDSPVHRLCGEFALQVCPYLAYTQYKATDTDEKTQKLAEKLHGEGIEALYNPTQTMERLQFFVFAKVAGWTPKFQPMGIFVIMPKKPYLEIEYWREGVQISREQAVKYLKKEDQKLIPK